MPKSQKSTDIEDTLKELVKAVLTLTQSFEAELEEIRKTLDHIDHVLTEIHSEEKTVNTQLSGIAQMLDNDFKETLSSINDNLASFKKMFYWYKQKVLGSPNTNNKINSGKKSYRKYSRGGYRR